MSGHSKWHRIKHKKAQTDNKRGKLFTQLTRDIRSSTRQGKDPTKNAALREAIERAKKFNLPQSNIDRILSEDSSNTTDVTYEGYDTNGIALLITATTDNTNRTVAELRNLLKKHRGRLAEQGSVRWKFQPMGLLEATIPDRTTSEELELALIDAGAEGIDYHDSTITISGSPDARPGLEATLAQADATLISSAIVQQAPPDQRQDLTDEHAENLAQLINELEEQNDVTAVYTDAA